MSEDTWIMRGMEWDDPLRIRSWQELVNWVNEVGFLPLFKNDIPGFSAEEHVHTWSWWTGDPEQDPWEWREIIARSHQIAYGKFFDKKAGFISLEWLPVFANYRRDGYDFDIRILSTDLKKRAGFGKGGAKNYPGITTGLQMQTYLVITDFVRRKNKKGAEYGMPVSILQPPEAVWGYENVTKSYMEKPEESWDRISGRLREVFSESNESRIIRVIGKRPGTRTV